MFHIKICFGSFRAKSTRSPDMTISDFDKNWNGIFKKKSNFFNYLVKYGSKYGSVNFDQNVTTHNGQKLISQLLWDLQKRFLYQIESV